MQAKCRRLRTEGAGHCDALVLQQHREKMHLTNVHNIWKEDFLKWLYSQMQAFNASQCMDELFSAMHFTAVTHGGTVELLSMLDPDDQLGGYD